MLNRFACAVVALLVVLVVVPAGASAKVAHFWSGTVTLDYLADQGTGAEHFQGTAQINASSENLGKVTSSPPDPGVDGLDLWHMYGSVSGTFSNTTVCNQNATVSDPSFAPSDAGGEGVQFFDIYGPGTPSPGDQFVLSDMVVNLAGTENCGDGNQPFTRQNAPFPGRFVFNDLGIPDVNLRLPMSGADGPTASNGGLRWQGTKSYHSNSDFSTYDSAYTYDLTYTGADKDCAKAKAKVAKLKKQIKKADGKRKEQLQDQLRKAKKAQKKACDEPEPRWLGSRECRDHFRVSGSSRSPGSAPARSPR